MINEVPRPRGSRAVAQDATPSRAGFTPRPQARSGLLEMRAGDGRARFGLVSVPFCSVYDLGPNADVFCYDLFSCVCFAFGVTLLKLLKIVFVISLPL